MWHRLLTWASALAGRLAKWTACAACPLKGECRKADDGMTNRLPAPGDARDVCPVCGYRPCGERCPIGLTKWDLERLEDEFLDPPWEREEDDDE